MSDADLQGVDARLDSGIRKFLNAEGALESRTSALSASPKSVTKQLTNLTSTLNAQSAWIADERKRFSGMMSS